MKAESTPETWESPKREIRTVPNLQPRQLRQVAPPAIRELPRASVTNCHQIGGLEQGNVFFHTAAGRKSKVKVISELVPSGGFEGESVLCLPLASGGFQGSLASLAL